MKIQSGLLAAALAASLSACSASDKAEAPATDTAAPIVETPEEKVAKIAASMTPRDYRLKVVTCNYLVKAAPRAKEGTFTPELTAAVAAAGEGIEFFKLVRWLREVEPEPSAFNEAQKAGQTVPQTLEAATPEYRAQVEECLTIVTVEKPKVEATV